MVETTITTNFHDKDKVEEPNAERKFSVPIAKFVLNEHGWQPNPLYTGFAFGRDAIAALADAQSKVEDWNKKSFPKSLIYYRISGDPEENVKHKEFHSQP